MQEWERAASDVVEKAGETIDRAIDEVTDAPGEGEVSRFEWRGATAIVEEIGQGERTFLLIHGIGMGRGVFGDVSKHLREHGRVVLIDQPGYGDAPEPPRTMTMERRGDLVAALIAERQYSDVVLIGHSMGTQVATEVAVRHPHLISRLVLVAPTVDVHARKARLQVARLGLDLAHESWKVFLLGAREYVRTGPHLRQKFHAMMVHQPEKSYPKVTVPALVLRGATDRVCPERWCREVAEMLPDSAYDELADHGHETMIRDGEPATSAIVDWLHRR